MTVRTETGVEEREVPDSLRLAPVLTDGQIARLVEAGVKIEQLYGTPMDIEWALQGDEVSVVQARPITVRGEQDDFEWNDSQQGEYLWSNVNLGRPSPRSRHRSRCLFCALRSRIGSLFLDIPALAT